MAAYVAFAPLVEDWKGHPETGIALELIFHCRGCESNFPAFFVWSPTDLTGYLKSYPEHPIEVKHRKLDDDDWDNDDVPMSPKEELGAALDGIHLMLTPLPTERWRANIFLRMCFSQVIGAMEAYLCDTLISMVMSSPEAIERLLKQDRDLKGKAFGLIDILSDPNIVKTKVLQHLRNIVYHKLDRVNALYLSSMGINILGDNGRNERLMKAVQIRHDIVHRNGKNVNGEIVVVDAQAVETLIRDVRQLVDDIVLKRYQLLLREPREVDAG